MDIKVFAHRGFSGKYPENTMLAFEKALEAGADGIETDVHLSKDGKLVIIHDELLARTCCGRPGTVSDYTLDELTAINAPAAFADEFGHTPIPSFDEFCRFLKGNSLIVNVEIKTNIICYSGLEELLVASLRKNNLIDRIIISSFNPFSVLNVRRLEPALKCGFLIYRDNPAGVTRLIKPLGFDFYHPEYSLVTEEMLSECVRSSVKLNLWTVNTAEAVGELLEKDAKTRAINGFIGNHPDIVLAALGR